MSIGRKIIIVAVSAVFLCGLTLTIYNSILFQNALTNEFYPRIIAISENLDTNLKTHLPNKVPPERSMAIVTEVEEFLQKAVDQQDVIYAIVFRNNQKFAAVNVFGEGDILIKKGRDLGDIEGYSCREVFVKSHTAYELRIPVKKETEDLGEIALGFSRARLNKNIRDNIIRSFLFLLVVVTVLALTIKFIFKRQLNDPLKIVVDRMQSFANDYTFPEQTEHFNPDAKTELVSHDEIGHLALTFNGMSSALKEAKEHIEEQNRTLEKRVQQKTEELQKVQAIVLRSEKMSAVGQLAAGVAHEINNPLGVIMGFAQALVRRLATGDPMEVPLKSIEREAVRCKNLVQDLLTFSRVSKVEREPMDLNKTVLAALSLVMAQAKMSQITVQSDIASDLPHVLGNPNQIQQVVINLANNAIDAMKDGGTLTVKTELLKEKPLSWVCLKMIDTGSGIPPELLTKIFEPFFTTKPVGKGTGLGLSLVHEMVKKHSGIIDVESRPGRTEFCIKFPVRTSEMAAKI